MESITSLSLESWMDHLLLMRLKSLQVGMTPNSSSLNSLIICQMNVIFQRMMRKWKTLHRLATILLCPGPLEPMGMCGWSQENEALKSIEVVRGVIEKLLLNERNRNQGLTLGLLQSLEVGDAIVLHQVLMMIPIGQLFAMVVLLDEHVHLDTMSNRYGNVQIVGIAQRIPLFEAVKNERSRLVSLMRIERVPAAENVLERMMFPRRHHGSLVAVVADLLHPLPLRVMIAQFPLQLLLILIVLFRHLLKRLVLGINVVLLRPLDH